MKTGAKGTALLPRSKLAPRLVAFLRAINVGGHTVTMEELRKQFAALGLRDVETFIASGNVIFTSRAGSVPALERRIEERLRASLGYEVRTFVRTGSEIATIAGYQPFQEPQLRAATTLNVGFFAEPLSAAARKSVLGLRTDIDDFHVNGRELYWLCKTRQSDSKFSNAVFERTLKVSATFRNVNTIRRLAAKHGFSAK